MTSQKQLKSRIRSRMAKTGERYAAARRHVTGGGDDHTRRVDETVVDLGWRLQGGTDPDAAALANVLANRGVEGPDGPLSEPMLFAITGALGAGYILWEFQHDDSRHVTLGFSYRWNYLEDRLRLACDRLGLDVEWRRTGGAKGAAEHLRKELTEGNAMIVWPDRFHVGYWHVPESLDGLGGHPVVAYALNRDRIHLDDRNLAPLTVAADDLDRARARVGSYQNASLVVRSRDLRLGGGVVRDAVRAGLDACVEHLSRSSDSFSLPTWRKWSRMLVDPKGAKSWPRVFADRRSLLASLLSVWEGVSPAGTTGGHLRELFADSLAAAADLLSVPALGSEAECWREIGGRWYELAEAAAPADVPAVRRARELTAAVTGSVAEGDEAAAERAAAADSLWALRDEYAAEPPFEVARDGEIFAAMSQQLGLIFEAETAAIERLGGILR